MLKGLPGLRAGWLVLAVAVAVLAACHEIPRNEHESKLAAQYQQYAGPPVESFTYLGRYDSWTSLGENQVVVWTTPSDAYLITVRSPCPELPFAQHIGLTQSSPSTVSQRFDFVVVERNKCWIQSIQPVNYLQMKRDLRQKSAEGQAPAEAKPQEHKQ